MNRTKPRAPLWLICDPTASVRLWLAIVLLYSGCCLFATDRKPPGAWGTAWITVYLSVAEALLRWAIARQARRLNGLSPKGVPIFLLPEARTPQVWRARLKAFLDMVKAIDAHARRLARRIKAAMEAKPQTIPAARPVAPARIVAGAPGIVFMASWTRGIPAPP
jgi:hypothetical protein